MGEENGVREKEIALSSVKIYLPNSAMIPVNLFLWHDPGGKWSCVADMEAESNNFTMHKVKRTAPSPSINSVDDSLTVDSTTKCHPPALCVSLSPGKKSLQTIKVHETELMMDARFDIDKW